MSAPTRPDGTAADLDGHTHDGRYHSHIGGAVPHDHAEPAPAARRRGRWVGGAVLAVLSLLVGWLPFIPADNGGQAYSVSQLHGLCQSGLGQLAQTFSAQDAANCSALGTLYGVAVGGVLLGLGLAVLGAALDRRGQR